MFQLKPFNERETDFEALALGLGGAMLVAAWSWSFWSRFVNFMCPLKVLTGVPCMFCGGTRAMHAWTHGHWAEAFAMNPLVFVLAVGFVGYLVYAVYCVVRRPARRLRFTALEPTAPQRMRVLAYSVLFAVGGINWAYLIFVGR